MYQVQHHYPTASSRHVCIDSLDSNLPGRNVVIIRHWRLVGRHYGALTGYNKAEMVDIYGKEQVQIWRRSNEVPPPPITEEHPFYKAQTSKIFWIKFQALNL